jgi:hypothetical protein
MLTYHPEVVPAANCRADRSCLLARQALRKNGIRSPLAGAGQRILIDHFDDPELVVCRGADER